MYDLNCTLQSHNNTEYCHAQVLGDGASLAGMCQILSTLCPQVTGSMLMAMQCWLEKWTAAAHATFSNNPTHQLPP